MRLDHLLSRENCELNKPAEPEVDDLREQIVKEAGRKTGGGETPDKPEREKDCFLNSFTVSLSGFVRMS